MNNTFLKKQFFLVACLLFFYIFDSLIGGTVTSLADPSNSELPVIEINKGGEENNTEKQTSVPPNEFDSHANETEKESAGEQKSGEDNNRSGLWPVVLLSIAAGLFVVTALIVFLIIRMKKKKKLDAKKESGYETSTKEKGYYVTLTSVKNPRLIFKCLIVNRVSIGRGEKNSIKLGFDSAVSEYHCVICKKGDLFFVNDLNSKNGTYCEGVRVCEETPLMNGKRLGIGRDEYIFRIEE